MMLPNNASLAAHEQALSREISQLAANVYQDIQSLAGLDVAVQGSVVQGLTAKVQDQLRRYRSLLSDLQYAAEEQETPDQTQKVADVLAKHQSDYDSIHKAFQNARIIYQRRKEESYVRQRQELIGSVDFSQRQQKIASEQDAVLGSQDVTASLRRTRQLMAQNMAQTHGNISVIAASNKRLQDAGDELSGQKEVFKESHGLLGTLKTQSLLDRFASWGVFTFILLVALYIVFRRTPAFMKQPLYSLLHMKHGGKPFDHNDYASVNIPAGTFKPAERPWAAAGPGADEAYPSDWAAWDANFADIPAHEHMRVFQDDAQRFDAEELLNEGLQREAGEMWHRGPDGTLLLHRLQRMQQHKQQPSPSGEQQSQIEQQQQPLEEPGTPMQQPEPPAAGRCDADDAACHPTAGGSSFEHQLPPLSTGPVDGEQPFPVSPQAAATAEAAQPSSVISEHHATAAAPQAAPVPVDEAHFTAQRHQQYDEEEAAFHSGEAFHPSDDSASSHFDAHWDAERMHQPWHTQQQPSEVPESTQQPTALGIVDPDAVAATGSPATGHGDHLTEHELVEELDQDELQYIRQQQEQSERERQQQQEMHQREAQLAAEQAALAVEAAASQAALQAAAMEESLQAQKPAPLDTHPPAGAPDTEAPGPAAVEPATSTQAAQSPPGLEPHTAENPEGPAPAQGEALVTAEAPPSEALAVETAEPTAETAEPAAAAPAAEITRLAAEAPATETAAPMAGASAKEQLATGTAGVSAPETAEGTALPPTAAHAPPAVQQSVGVTEAAVDFLVDEEYPAAGAPVAQSAAEMSKAEAPAAQVSADTEGAGPAAAQPGAEVRAAAAQASAVGQPIVDTVATQAPAADVWQVEAPASDMVTGDTAATPVAVEAPAVEASAAGAAAVPLPAEDTAPPQAPQTPEPASAPAESQEAEPPVTTLLSGELQSAGAEQQAAEPAPADHLTVKLVGSDTPPPPIPATAAAKSAQPEAPAPAPAVEELQFHTRHTHQEEQAQPVESQSASAPSSAEAVVAVEQAVHQGDMENAAAHHGEEPTSHITQHHTSHVTTNSQQFAADDGVQQQQGQEGSVAQEDTKQQQQQAEQHEQQQQQAEQQQQADEHQKQNLGTAAEVLVEHDLAPEETAQAAPEETAQPLEMPPAGTTQHPAGADAAADEVPVTVQQIAGGISAAAADIAAAVRTERTGISVQPALQALSNRFLNRVRGKFSSHAPVQAGGAAKHHTTPPVRPVGGSSFIAGAAASELPLDLGRPKAAGAEYHGVELDYPAEDPSLEHHDSAMAHTATADDDNVADGQSDPHIREPVDLSGLSKLIEEEQARAFTLMDMDVGLYHYEDNSGAATLRETGNQAVGSNAGSQHVDL